MIFYLAFRNLLLQRKRYALMGAAIALGFALVTVLTGASHGALETVKGKAARYYSGHVNVTGITGWSVGLSSPENIIKTISESSLPVRTVSRRTVYYGKETRLFFGGNFIRLLRPVGVDFEAEKNELARLSFIDGGIEGMLGEEGENGILISRAASGILGARLGDDIILYLITTGGQYNTANMVVKGIFDETSIFGYAAYVRNEDINRLLQREKNDASEIAVYAEEGTNIKRFAEKLRKALEKEYPVFPPILTREDYSRQRAENRGNEKETLAVISVDAQLDQLKDILEAFLSGTYFVLIVFLLIVMAGILNTYRVLVYERTREIGTMRALGMQRNDVKNLFLLEALYLALISSAAGFLIGFVTLQFAGLIDIGGVTAAGMFTESGKLRFFVNSRIVLLNLLLMVSSVLIAAWGPAGKASRLNPVEALRKD